MDRRLNIRRTVKDKRKGNTPQDNIQIEFKNFQNRKI